MLNSWLKILSVSFILMFIIFSFPVSAEDFYTGDVIGLGGSSPSNYVYLFVVGPNLPSGGANPEDLLSAVVTDDPDSFVRVSVNSGRWNYKWDTSTASGTPDAGVYRVYAASEPVGLSDLSSADHSMTVVNIVRPYVTAKADGGMINSVPATGNELNSNPDEEAESGAGETYKYVDKSGNNYQMADEKVNDSITEPAESSTENIRYAGQGSDSGVAKETGFTFMVALSGAFAGVLIISFFYRKG